MAVRSSIRATNSGPIPAREPCAASDRNTPALKVTYKAIKTGAFFVVAGLDGGKKFYSRYELGTDPSKRALRGFTFSYPESRADLDRVALAIANAFEPFSAASAPTAAEATSAATPSPAAKPT